jgi:class 3 adenylate cyclase
LKSIDPKFFKEKYARYLPFAVVERFMKTHQSLEKPEMRTYPAATAFIDISGFTKLSESLVEKYGDNGAEKLNRYVSNYFERLINVILKWGGDIIKFAGDAMLVVWKSRKSLLDEKFEEEVNRSRNSTVTKKDLQTLLVGSNSYQHEPLHIHILHAVACNLELLAELNNFKPVETEEVYLKLHSSVGSGNLVEFFVGGYQNMWEYFVAGGPIKDMSSAGDDAKTGELVTSMATFEQIKEFVKEFKVLQTGNVKIMKVDEVDLPLPSSCPKISSGMEKPLITFVPPLVQQIAETEVIGEYRRAYVMFVKLLGLDYDKADSVLEVLQDAVETVQAGITFYEGTVARLLADDKGTRFKIVFGLPGQVHDNDAARVVLAAVDLQEQLNRLKTPSVIGIAHGRVFCGEAGCSTRSEYTAVGFKVNLAARIMAVAEKQNKGILCDESTFESARTKSLEFEALPQKVSVKGVSTEIQLYRPLGKKKGNHVKLPDQMMNMGTRRGTFGITASRKQSIFRRGSTVVDVIGREEELSIAKGDLKNVLEVIHKSRVFIVEGESGIGKSVMVQKIARDAEVLGFEALVSHASWMEKSKSFGLWKPIFQQAMEITNANDGDIQKQIFKFLGNDGEMAEMAPLLNSFFDTTITETDFTLQMSPDGRTDKIKKLLTHILHRVAQIGHVAIFLEDMHWADAASWALAVDVSSIPGVFLLISTRPFPKSPPMEIVVLKKQTNATFRILKNLHPKEAEKLVCKRLGVAKVPPRVMEVINSKAQGHPLYIEELCQSMLDQKLITIDHEDGGSVTVSKKLTDEGVKSFPDNLQQVVSARIDNLSPKLQMTIKVCSVVGSDALQPELIAAVHPHFETKEEISDKVKEERIKLIESHMSTLSEAGFFTPTPPPPEPATSYAFVVSPYYSISFPELISEYFVPRSCV